MGSERTGLGVGAIGMPAEIVWAWNGWLSDADLARASLACTWFAECAFRDLSARKELRRKQNAAATTIGRFWRQRRWSVDDPMRAIEMTMRYKIGAPEPTVDLAHARTARGLTAAHPNVWASADKPIDDYRTYSIPRFGDAMTQLRVELLPDSRRPKTASISTNGSPLLTLILRRDGANMMAWLPVPLYLIAIPYSQIIVAMDSPVKGLTVRYVLLHHDSRRLLCTTELLKDECFCYMAGCVCDGSIARAGIDAAAFFPIVCGTQTETLKDLVNITDSLIL